MNRRRNARRLPPRFLGLLAGSRGSGLGFSGLGFSGLGFSGLGFTTLKLTTLKLSALGFTTLGFTTLGCSFMLDFDELSEANPASEAGSSLDDTDDGDDSDDSDDSSTDDTADDLDDSSVDDTSDDGGDASSGADDDSNPADAGADDGSDPDSGLTSTDGGSCTDDCDDGDPCTIDGCVAGRCQNEPISCETDDSCTQASCVDGQCVETRAFGVVEDGFEERIEASTAYRSTLVGAGDRFYRATYGVWDGQPDILFSVFGREGDAPLAEARASDVLPDGIVPMSPAALAPDTRLGLSLHVYVAVKADDQGDAAAGSVARMRFNRELALLGEVELISSLPNYRYESDRLGPAAGITSSGEPYVVWNGCTTTGTPEGPDCVTTEPSNGSGGLYLQFGEDELDVSDPGAAFIPEPRSVTGLATLDAGDTPGAIWMANESPGGVDILLGSGAGNPQAITQCNDGSGLTGHSLDAWRSLGNLWTTSWSTRMGTTFSTELTVLRCANDGSCTDLGLPVDANSCTEEQTQARVIDGARSVVTRTLARPGDPAERIYQSAVAVTSEDDETSIELIVNQLDFDLSGEAEVGSSTPVGRVQLAPAGADEATGWPALATVAPDRIAVSWLESRGSTDSAAVRVQRYRICFED